MSNPWAWIVQARPTSFFYEGPKKGTDGCLVTAILAGLAAGWLPWFDLQHRTIFQFYAIAFQPYVVLSAVFVLGLLLGPAEASIRRRRIGLLVVGCYCLLTLALFAFYWPIYTAQVIPYPSWRLRMWFPSWV